MIFFYILTQPTGKIIFRWLMALVVTICLFSCQTLMCFCLALRERKKMCSCWGIHPLRDRWWDGELNNQQSCYVMLLLPLHSSFVYPQCCPQWLLWRWRSVPAGTFSSGTWGAVAPVTATCTALPAGCFHTDTHWAWSITAAPPVTPTKVLTQRLHFIFTMTTHIFCCQLL